MPTQTQGNKTPPTGHKQGSPEHVANSCPLIPSFFKTRAYKPYWTKTKSESAQCGKDTCQYPSKTAPELDPDTPPRLMDRE